MCGNVSVSGSEAKRARTGESEESRVPDPDADASADERGEEMYVGDITLAKGVDMERGVAIVGPPSPCPCGKPGSVHQQWV